MADSKPSDPKETAPAGADRCQTCQRLFRDRAARETHIYRHDVHLDHCTGCVRKTELALAAWNAAAAAPPITPEDH